MLYALGNARPELAGKQHFIAPNASIIGNVVLHEGVSVWFNAVLRGDNDRLSIGAHSNVQDGAILHTDSGIELRVGRNVTIGHRAMLHGCSIGDNSLIGIGATVLNHASIGRNSLVGAHALVPEGRSFPDGVLLLGAPAKVARELSAEEIDQLAQSAAAYTQQSARYAAECRPCD